MKQSIILTLIASLALMSCETKKEERITKTEEITKDTTNKISHKDTLQATIPDAHSSKTSLDWVGTYEGILPCADCEGIKTTVTLNKDETIKVVSAYMKGKTKLVEEGQFKWTADNNALYLDTKDKNRYFYKVGENKLILLSQEGAEIEGALADKYVLIKK